MGAGASGAEMERPVLWELKGSLSVPLVRSLGASPRRRRGCEQKDPVKNKDKANSGLNLT